ncbi:MAG: hypothetical protein HY684_02345 [Chloroflexi bacterium]|nr:hypothetical protein [Chloroflexota bacterium]
MEKKGIPAVLIAHDRFEAAARAQARALGLPDLPVIVVPQPQSWTTKEEEVQHANEAVGMIQAALLARPAAKPAR